MKTRTLTTIEEVREVFQPLIDRTAPSHGDWLNGRSFEEAMDGIAKPPNATDDYARTVVERKIKEWEGRKGERQLFFLNRSTHEGNPSIEVRVAWESQLTELIGKMYEGPSENGLPIFVEQEFIDAVAKL